jgi:hypothetical protein
MSGFGIDIFDQSLTRKGKKDTKHIQLLKVALNELHSLLMDRKDYLSSSSKETSSDMLAIWKFSCNSFFKVLSNSSTYFSLPSVKLRIKESLMIYSSFQE